jgi:hypothetical protein
MDYKVIIILLALLFLIILVYREVSTLKEQMGKNINNITSQYMQNNDRMLLKFQNNMNKYVTQIKGISSDNLQQLRKITMLNHQPVIRKFTNHFTETDNSEIRTDVQYLSDAKIGNPKNEIQDNIFEKKEKSNEYYMSEDETKKTKDSDGISDCAERSSKINKSKETSSTRMRNQALCDDQVMCNDGKWIINDIERSHVLEPEYCDDIPLYNTIKNDEESIPIYIPNTIPDQIIDNSQIDNNDDYGFEINSSINSDNEDDINNMNAENNDEIIKVDIPANESQFSVIVKNTMEGSVIEDDGYNSEEKGSITITPINYKNDPKNKDEIEIDMYNMMTGNKLITGLNSMEISKLIQVSNNIKSNDIYIDDIEEKEDMEANIHDNISEDTFNVESNIQKIDLTESIKIMSNDDLKILPIDEQIKNAREKKQKDEDTIGLENKSRKSKASKISVANSLISVGGTKKKKQVFVINTKGDLSDHPYEINNKQEEINDKVDFNSSITILKNCEEYTFNDLRELARKLGVPTTYKEKNKTRQYKKDDLFKNIKGFVDLNQVKS